MTRIVGVARAASMAMLMLLLGAGAALGSRLVVRLPPGLSPEDGRRLQHTIDHASVSGRVHGPPFRLHAGAFEYLLDHPEFAAHVTRVLNVGNYRVWREADGLWLDDGGGAIGRFATVHASSGSRVVRLRGRYKTRYLPAIHGEAVVVLEYTSDPGADAGVLITPTLTGFVRIDSVFVEALSRLMSDTAHTKAERLARRVLRDFADTAGKIESDPARLLQLLGARPGVAAQELDEFRRVLSAGLSAPRAASGSSPPFPRTRLRRCASTGRCPFGRRARAWATRERRSASRS